MILRNLRLVLINKISVRIVSISSIFLISKYKYFYYWHEITPNVKSFWKLIKLVNVSTAKMLRNIRVNYFSSETLFVLKSILHYGLFLKDVSNDEKRDEYLNYL